MSDKISQKQSLFKTSQHAHLLTTIVTLEIHLLHFDSFSFKIKLNVHVIIY